MSEKIINRGDSLTFGINIPSGSISKVQDIWLTVGYEVIGKLSNNTLITGSFSGSQLYLAPLTSTQTRRWIGSYPVIVAVDWTDLGIRKTKQTEALKLTVIDNVNPFYNDSTSSIVDVTIDVQIGNDSLTSDAYLAEIHRGYDAIELYRIQKNLPSASLDDIWNYYLDTRTYKFMANCANGEEFNNPFSASLALDGTTALYPFFTLNFYDGNTFQPRTDVSYELINDKSSYRVKLPILENLGNVITGNLEYLYIVAERK